MTNVVAKYAAKKLLSGQMEKYKKKDVAGNDDPYFTLVPHPRKPGKMKKVKKQVPNYIPEKDAVVLASVRRRAYALDVSLFNFFGIRFGWSSVVGIIPAVGDVIDLLFAMLLLKKCNEVEGGLDSGTRLKMMINIFIDFAIGLVPFVGDLADAAWKCNTKNVRLLERQLDAKYKPDAVRHAEGELPEAQRPPPASVLEDFSDDDEANRRLGPPPEYQSRQSSRRERRDDRNDVRRPDAARVPTERRGEAPERTGSNRWFSSGSRRERQPDVEMGQVDRPGRNGTKSSRR